MSAYFMTECESRFIIDLLNDLYTQTEYEHDREEITQAIEILMSSTKYDMTKVVEGL